MKSTYKLLLASVIAVSLMPVEAQAASLLGGLLHSGNSNSSSPSSGSSNSSGGLVGGLNNTVNGLLGGGDGGGGLLGNGGVTLPVDIGGLDVGVPNVVHLNTSSNSNGGSTVGVDLLGGGGGNISTNPLGLLGNGGGITVTLPDLGGVTDIIDDDDDDDGGNGGGGGSGGGGGDGGHGGNGGSGGGNGGSGGGSDGGSGSGGGTTIINYSSGGGGGGSFAIPAGISSRLQQLLRILQERDYLRVSNGRAVCLNSFGVAEVGGWVPQKDWGKLQQVLSTYSQDIYTLRQLLANCRSADQRQALNLTSLNRVIALDIGKDGRPILLML